mgnify:CR=1 FL=1
MVPDVWFADYDDLASVEAALDEAAGRIGTLIVEPVQCEGGLRVPSAGFLPGLRALCDDRDMVLIFDEVQTGVARTGEWFCYEISDVRPDVMALAKGLGGGVPLGAMLCTAETAEAFQPGAHASTFGGNPLATRAGLEVMRVIADDALLDHTFEVGEHLERGLEGLVKAHPGLCVEARGYGLLRGLELVQDDRELGKRVVAECLERGLLINAIGGHILRFVPPLIIETGHVDTALGIIDEVLGSL